MTHRRLVLFGLAAVAVVLVGWVVLWWTGVIREPRFSGLHQETPIVIKVFRKLGL